MSRRRRSNLGFIFPSPMTLAALAALGVGAYFLLRPKVAKAADDASKKAQDAVDQAAAAAVLVAASVPAGSSTGAEVTTVVGSKVETFVDPGSGVTIAGPSTGIEKDIKRTVAKGESWSNIAARAYGDYRWWPALWDANRMGAKYQDPGMLRIGDEIRVPVLSQDAKYKAAIFARAEADRQWEVGGKKGARPASTFASTPLQGVTLPPGSPISLPRSSGVTEPTSLTEPAVMASGSRMGPGYIPATDTVVSAYN